MNHLSSSDIADIQSLVARYCITTDNADADAFMEECWVKPEEFGGYESGPFGSMKTWHEMHAFEKHHVGPGGMANGMRHQATNLFIWPISPTEATVTHDLIVLNVAEGPRIVATGRYNDSLVVKTKDGWRFKSRHLSVDPAFFKGAMSERK